MGKVLKPPVDEGGSGPSQQDQAEDSIRQRRLLNEAAGTVKVCKKGSPDQLGVGSLRFDGDGIEESFDSSEKRITLSIWAEIFFGTAAARPESPEHPCIYIATDTGVHSSWDGSTWRTI